MININQISKSAYSGNTAIKQEVKQVANRMAERRAKSPSTGCSVQLTKSDWIEICEENKRRFICMLRANPNDEMLRENLRKTQALLDKLRFGLY